jgi:hypothetical protein
MEKLGQKDHDALVLRFFENKTGLASIWWTGDM